MSRCVANDRIVRCESDGSITVGCQEAVADYDHGEFSDSPFRFLPGRSRLPDDHFTGIPCDTSFPVSFLLPPQLQRTQKPKRRLKKTLTVKGLTKTSKSKGSLQKPRVHRQEPRPMSTKVATPSDLGSIPNPKLPPPPRRSPRSQKPSTTEAVRVNNVHRRGRSPADDPVIPTESSSDEADNTPIGHSSASKVRTRSVSRASQPVNYQEDASSSSSSSSDDYRRRSKSGASSTTSARSSSRRRSPSTGMHQRPFCPICNALFGKWQHSEVHMATQHADVITKGLSIEENARMADAGMRICEKCHKCRRIGHRNCQPKPVEVEAPPPPLVNKKSYHLECRVFSSKTTQSMR